jgi:serpin B
MTRLVLANAIYFKGDWADQFDPKQTAELAFHLATGTDTTCKMMSRKGDYPYAEMPDLQAAELPYAGSDLSMIVLLPRTVTGLTALEGEITAAKLTEWTSTLRKQEVLVFLPKFKLTSEFSLGKTLVAMGMTDAFSGADFSGMDGTRSLSISEVVHKAFVDVNEEGTEAAAATAVVIRATAVQRVTAFRADHPFLFLIRDRHTGSILFMGRVMNPAD